VHASVFVREATHTEISKRVLERARRRGAGGEVEDGIEAGACQLSGQILPRCWPRRSRPADRKHARLSLRPVLKIVDLAAGDQPVDGVRADEPRPAGDEHAAVSLRICLGHERFP
jgi:hypothetical protein